MQPGETVRLTGLSRHDEHGERFQVAECVSVLPASVRDPALPRLRLVRGIGKLDAITAHFGADTLKVIDEPDRLPRCTTSAAGRG